MSRRKKGRSHCAWWKRPECRFEVYHGPWTSYLIHFPRWGTPAVRASVPRGWGCLTPGDFAELFGPGVIDAMKKPTKTAQGTAHYAASREDLGRIYPLLSDHLTATAYEGEAAGSRITSTLLIFAQDGTWRAVLRDRQEKQCLWVSANTFDELLGVLENAIGDENAVWREDRMAGAPEASRKKPEKRG